MKNLTFALLVIIVMAVCSCSGGSSSSYSGKNPFKDVSKLLLELEDKAVELKNTKDKNASKELWANFMEFSKKTMEQVKEESVKMEGQRVPFSGSPFQLLEIADVVITKTKVAQIDCTVDIQVFCRPKKDITLTNVQRTGSSDKFTTEGESLEDATCSIYIMQYALFMDDSGNIIDQKKFRPFISGKYDFQYNAGDKLTPTQYCNDNGTIMHIQLGRGVYANFKEIRFVTETELETLINNSKNN